MPRVKQGQDTPSTEAVRLQRRVWKMMPQAIECVVQTAYMELPLETDPVFGPFRERLGEAKEQSRSDLVERGCLTAQELDTLSEREACTTAIRRFYEQYPTPPDPPAR